MGTAAGARDQSDVTVSRAASAWLPPYHRMPPNSTISPAVSHRFTWSATPEPPVQQQFSFALPSCPRPSVCCTLRWLRWN